MPTYTNLFTNPRPLTATAWTTADGTGGSSTATLLAAAGGPAGDRARRMTWTVASTAGSGGHIIGSGTSIPATAGAAYSFAFYARCSKAQPINPRIQWVDSAASVLSTVTGSSTTLVANTWTQIKFENVIAPASTAYMRGNAHGVAGQTWAIGDTLDVQAATFVQGATVPEPFHGNLTDTGTNDYSWTGTADASTSTLVVSVGPPVPTGVTATPVTDGIDLSWNAMTGVTGYGGQGISITTGQDPATIDWSGATTLFDGLTATSFSDTGLPVLQRRAYRIWSNG